MKTIKIRGARTHNLKNVDLDLPRDQLIVITGLSGSGKSSLVEEILSKGLHAKVARSRVVPGRHKRFEGIEHIDKVIHITQAPIGTIRRVSSASGMKADGETSPRFEPLKMPFKPAM